MVVQLVPVFFRAGAALRGLGISMVIPFYRIGGRHRGGVGGFCGHRHGVSVSAAQPVIPLSRTIPGCCDGYPTCHDGPFPGGVRGYPRLGGSPGHRSLVG